MSKKDLVLNALLNHCQAKNDFVFHNDLVKEFCKQYKFGNPFDVTKLDDTSKFPLVMINGDYFLLHMGSGYHRFVKGIHLGFHSFEKINEDQIVEWKYRKSLLNEFDMSESNILSVGYNQKIIHDFMYEDITANPKVYNARRTKTSISYKVGNEFVKTTNLQIEVDLTMELDGAVTIFEGKNNFPENFAVYQLFNPYLYYQKLKSENHLDVKSISCCYLLRKKNKHGSVIRVYNYGFDMLDDLSSIRLLKAKEYRLIQR